MTPSSASRLLAFPTVSTFSDRHQDVMADVTSLEHDESIDSRNVEFSHPMEDTGCATPPATKDPDDKGQDDDDIHYSFSKNPVGESGNAEYPQNDGDLGDSNGNFGEILVCERGNTEYSPSASKISRSLSLASDMTFSESHGEEEYHHCTKQWSKSQKILAALGCLSSILVCITRLMIDTGSRTYLIHSIVVFFDMVLIHLFTSTVWLVRWTTLFLSSLIIFRNLPSYSLCPLS